MLMNPTFPSERRGGRQRPARRCRGSPDLRSISPNITNSAGEASVWGEKGFTLGETQKSKVVLRLERLGPNY